MKPERGLHEVILVYTCQNATLLEITSRGLYGLRTYKLLVLFTFLLNIKKRLLFPQVTITLKGWKQYRSHIVINQIDIKSQFSALSHSDSKKLQQYTYN